MAKVNRQFPREPTHPKSSPYQEIIEQWQDGCAQMHDDCRICCGEHDDCAREAVYCEKRDRCRAIFDVIFQFTEARWEREIKIHQKGKFGDES